MAVNACNNCGNAYSECECTKEIKVMGIVKQHLLEKADKESLTDKLEQMAEYYGMSASQVEMMCQQAAAQKGILVQAQILDDFEDIDAVIAFERALQEEEDVPSRITLNLE